MGAACPPVSVADPAQERRALLRFIAAAREQGVQVLVFPELCLTGYTAGDLFFSLSTLIGGRGARAGAAPAPRPRTSPWSSPSGSPAGHEGRLFNVAAVIQ